uniref:Uncharacterized protein n=1 Tax=Chromera velia CCMP2878 TaxID=1169474 RepID=A0A0G4HNR3_9ALVE|eukprot:Cvel_7676.t1-p1 / transcript=Cvel_7676.t1 / gene=Cvel_7676 / organism=Chromera_velia_CCMP2878 / gene_product=hypothetical protein / transcript_product=hypothetical protein / location=Cvel_scaffold407:60085-62063(-) / protein_length=206 / sequence_SO=supercontig / SO=protein_coding / is_pseudo=false
MTCSPPVPLKVSRETPVLSLPDLTVSDNVDLSDDVRLSFRTHNGSELQRHFSSEEILNVLVEGTNKAGNTANCTIVVMADRCLINADRVTADSPCLCMSPLCSECKEGRLLLRRGTDTRCRDCLPPHLRVLAALGLFLLMVALVVGYTFMVTKDNLKMDMSEHAVAVKILMVFLTTLDFLADLTYPVFIVFREELAGLGLGKGGGG